MDPALPAPSPTKGSGNLPVRLALTLVGMLGAYLVLVAGRASDPTHWLDPLPGNDAATLEQLRSKLPEEVDRKLLDEHLRNLEQGEPATAVRKLHEFAARTPTLRYALSGAMLRKAEALSAGARHDLATLLARGATHLAEDDWRAWQVLGKCLRSAGSEDEAAKAEARAAGYQAARPTLSGDLVAAGLGIPLVAGICFWVVLGRILSAGGRQPGPAVPGARGGTVGAHQRAPSATEMGFEMPSQTEEAAAEGDAHPVQTITRVLDAEGRLEQARLLLEEAQWDAVGPIFKAAVKLNPANARRVGNLCSDQGKKFYDAQQLDHANRSFQLAVAYDPRNVRAQTYLANTMVRQGDLAAAVQHYLEVCSLEPQGAVGFYNLGICYEKTKEADNAVKAFEHALRLDPNMANAHFYLARILETQNQGEAAAGHWKRVLELSPGTPQAQRAQERLAALGK